MAALGGPAIACIGIIGKQDNPLHMSLFPPHNNAAGAYLEFSFLLNASLDIFDLRARDKNRVDQDLGLLHAMDERLSVWGWETGTGTRFAIVLDMYGRSGGEGEASGLGVKEGELRPAFRALQTAYIGLLRNPFYIPDEHTVAAGGVQIKAKGFIKEVERIGMAWKPGITTL
ncbi:MAG: hypothetical protein GOMPHAMPRED_002343 [Gomphillus americanus]|uniref:Uncharacterized protein n=1 Tax=Gomphillus americanus TaxID=1940652 RepID=A0A8H3IJZ5_9LECA|nr:MAG: hypothetical protein GOMPHAMPRED_002343 [Gomphillus americanus]